MILLDTDILIDLFRDHPPCVAWMSSLGLQPIAVSIVTAMELYADCRDKSEQRTVRQKVMSYQMLWPDERSAIDILPNFADAHLSHATGILDSLIAATALSHELTLHTFNQKHFAAFPKLKTAQPYLR